MQVKALENRPQLSRWVADYWEGFQRLNSSRRSHQGGIAPIPLSEIAAYMDVVYLFDVDERLKFIKMIQALDSVYVRYINDKAAKRIEAKRKERSTKPRQRRR